MLYHLKIAITVICLITGFTGVSYAADIALDGAWRFRIDFHNKGQDEQWYSKTLDDVVQLPGTMAQNQKGNVNTNHTFTHHLSRTVSYEGKAWYQRDIEIPSSWTNKHITLHLERSKLTKVWLDENLVGAHNSLGCEQVFDLTDLVTPGKHVLTICVDNKTRPGIGGGHQITNHTQTNWNGILGEMKLRAVDPVWIERVLAYPNVEEKSIHIKMSIGNQTGRPVDGKVTFDAASITKGTNHIVPQKEVSFSVDAALQTIENTYSLGTDAILWDEFTPNLYTLQVNLAAGEFKDTTQINFGLRTFNTEGTQFSINDLKIFLRGKHDALVWPLLGYPSMEVEDWVRVLRIAKSYGINHYRFHSCTPPEAAFEAADIVGIYMQPELYNFGDNLSEKPKGAQYCREEGMRILKTYGNHPSFVMFALGNEMHGGRDVRAGLIRAFRDFDPTRLYAQASNYDFNELIREQEDDYWTTVRTAPGAKYAVRGSFSHADLPLGHIQIVPPSTMYDFSEAVQNTPVPVIGHETGQFQVFPNFDEIKKYTGVQKPWNLEVFAERLKKAGMYDQWPDFFKASGALSVLCYREDIEAAMRTPGFGGFQLLDLQDFPGQGTALVGMLDAFMDAKGLITPEQWRQFCSETVLLARMEKYAWEAGEVFEARLQVSNYGPRDLQGKECRVQLVDDAGAIVKSERISLKGCTMAQGAVTQLGTVKWTLPALSKAKHLTLKLAVPESSLKNEYPLWVYPAHNQPQPPDNIHVLRKLDAELMACLGKGETILLLPEQDQMPNSIEGFFASDFWCYPMFRDIAKHHKKKVAPGTLGILCDPQHPALAQFPTEFHSNWQWWPLVMNSRAIILDETPDEYRPLVQVIDNFERNHKLGLVFECTVGPGKLLVCGINLPELLEHPQARQLYTSLLAYMDSDAFAPQTAFEPQQLVKLFQGKEMDSAVADSIDYSQFFNAN